MMNYPEAMQEAAQHHGMTTRIRSCLVRALMYGDIPDAKIETIRALGRKRWSFIPGVGKTTLTDLDHLVKYWTDEEKMLLERTPP
jgi:2-methylisocitrate lyase-like PEP mutase family enzyme